MRAFIVCVDYWDYLEITLPINQVHFDEVIVVTTPRDDRTQGVVEALWRTCDTILLTDLFYEPGAVFNKWKALEWALDERGRDGWICLLDADIILPYHFRSELDQIKEVGNLYTPRRRMSREIGYVPNYDDWARLYPLHRNEQEFAGYCQIFHASDPALGPPPWHETNWKHAGGADSFFQQKWSESKKIRPPFECLHLGEAGRNWCGRSTAFLDGTTPEDGAKRYSTLRNLIASRRVGPRRFEGEKY